MYSSDIHGIQTVRKGAIAVYIEPWHSDIEAFLISRKKSTEDRKALFDIYHSLWINDLFMERVNNREKWTLFDPYQCPDLHTLYGDEFKEKYVEYESNPFVDKTEVDALTLWKDILTLLFETGGPFNGFKDEANRRNQLKDAGIIRSSNLCSEIFQNTNPGTLVVEVHTEKKEALIPDTSDIYKVSASIKASLEPFLTLPADTQVTTDAGVSKPARKLNSLDSIDGNKIAFIREYSVNKEVAVCNLASIKLTAFDDWDQLEDTVRVAIRALDNVVELNYYPVEHAYNTNMQTRAIGLGVMSEHELIAKRGIMYGSQEHLEFIDELYERISYYAIKASADLAREKGSFPLFDKSEWAKGILPVDTINPNAKELTTREYVMDWDYLREYVRGGMRNAYLMAIAPTSTIGIVTDSTSSIEAIYKKVFVEANLSGNIKNIAPSLTADTWNYYMSAYDLDQIKVIKAAAVRQKWLDQGQSLNIYVRTDKATTRYLNDIYMTANKYGLKSTYYLRSLSPEMIEDENSAEGKGIVTCHNCE